MGPGEEEALHEVHGDGGYRRPLQEYYSQQVVPSWRMAADRRTLQSGQVKEQEAEAAGMMSQVLHKGCSKQHIVDT